MRMAASRSRAGGSMGERCDFRSSSDEARITVPSPALGALLAVTYRFGPNQEVAVAGAGRWSRF